MLPGRLPSVVLTLVLLGMPAWQLTSSLPTIRRRLLFRPTSRCSASSAAATTNSHVETGFAREFGERLAGANSGMTAADRDDRAALATFYAARQHEPVWMTVTGLSTPAEAVIAEIRRADDWGLEASAFKLPGLTRHAAPSCRAPLAPMPRSR